MAGNFNRAIWPSLVSSAPSRGDNPSDLFSFAHKENTPPQFLSHPHKSHTRINMSLVDKSIFRRYWS